MSATTARANLRTVLLVTLLFGVATGVYELALPLLLREWGYSMRFIGIIFALSGLVMVLARIYLGGLADRWGRKLVYGWALALCGVTTCATPLSLSLLWQVALKALRDLTALTRETLHPVILYEAGRDVFLERIGRFRGIEYTFQAGGTFLLGGVFALLSRTMSAASIYVLLLAAAGALLTLGSLLWAGSFRETHVETAQRRINLRDLVSLDLHPNLLLIALSGIIFAFGLQLSHSFYMALFFKSRFNATTADVSLIMVIHRFTLALPLLIVSNLRLKNLRAWYIAGLVMQGIVIAASAVLPWLWVSAGVWLLHDFIGAGIWLPIQSALIQQYSRDETRGLEVGKVLAWGGIGSALGPLVAGYLAEPMLLPAAVLPYAVTLPFLASGIFVLLSAVPLYWLKLAPAPRPAEEPAIAG